MRLLVQDVSNTCTFRNYKNDGSSGGSGITVMIIEAQTTVFGHSCYKRLYRSCFVGFSNNRYYGVVWVLFCLVKVVDWGRKITSIKVRIMKMSHFEEMVIPTTSNNECSFLPTAQRWRCMVPIPKLKLKELCKGRSLLDRLISRISFLTIKFG